MLIFFNAIFDRRHSSDEDIYVEEKNAIFDRRHSYDGDIYVEEKNAGLQIILHLGSGSIL